MRRVALALVGALVALAALVGCSGQSQAPAPAPTVTVTEAPADSGEQALVQALRAKSIISTDAEAAAAIRAGHAVCAAFDRGATVDEVLNAALSSGFPAYEAGFVVGASVGALCLEHKPLIDAWMAANTGTAA